MANELLLYPFRYFDPVRNRWIKARYVATKEQIAARHEQWEITGPPELRTPIATMFNLSSAPRPDQTPVNEPPPKDTPSRQPPKQEPPKSDPPVKEPPPTPTSDPPSLDHTERFFVLLFLRRYVTWCVRTRKFAAINGAARLYREMDRSERSDKPR